ncbi:MAG: phospholipase [Rhizobiales bacterium 17-65-6]|nr:MAG: phospholipase [Xanthobacter sp. 35-67-6]OYX90446.1 MAG: phospholipase [Azorhizobium sp. 32-67-21]OYZ98437.1 MAG: phospholipase [Rhizobiales bacterium 17-65-6]
MIPLDGPRLAPRTAPADALVVLIHGYGADGRDLIDIGEIWAERLPGAAFVAPHAPHPCGQAPVGREWFPLTQFDLHTLRRGVEGAAPDLARFIGAELARLGLGPDRLVLMGFSQGAMMALHLALALPAAPAAVVAYSGLWAGGEPPRHAPPPLLLIHGGADEVVPAAALQASVSALAQAGVPAQWHLSPDLGHGIDGDGLRLGADFIADALSRPR